jgi:NitT/TauT family transport system permease protein
MEHHAEILRGGIWRPRRTDWQDLVATVLLVGIIVLLGQSARQMLAPFAAARQPEISLSLAALPSYALRTTSRMLAAPSPRSSSPLRMQPWRLRAEGSRWC